MFVRSLRLNNFRNYALQDLQLPTGLIAFIGDNGQGKTNLLEAICVLATTKSPLVERDRELLRWDSDNASLQAEVQLSGGRGEKRRLLFAWKLENGSLSRDLRVGGVPQSALASWLGQLQVVAFFPHDLSIISGEPEQRRRFLNLELGKARPAHFADSARYRRALQQRNALLKWFLDPKNRRARKAPEGENTAPNAGLGTLGEWNKQVATYGARLWAARAQWVREIGPLLREVHGELSGLEMPLSIEYQPGLPNELIDLEQENFAWQRAFERALESQYESDMRRGTTGSGPHRDDLVFRLGEMDLRRFGSQGQSRLAVLSLKIALAFWVRETTGEAPILLLDDALSELDATRRERVLKLASSFEQSILTATDETFLHDVPARVLSIRNGQIIGALTT